MGTDTSKTALQAQLAEARRTVADLEAKLQTLHGDEPPTPNGFYLEREFYTLVRENPDYFRFLQRGSLDGVWYWDLENPEHEWLSPEFWRLFGYDPATMPHSSAVWKDIVHPHDLPHMEEAIRAHIEDPGRPYDITLRYRHRDGDIVWVRSRGVVIHNADGAPIRMIGAHTDCTELKRTEEALRQSQDYYHELVENAVSVIIKLDLEGHITFINRFGVELFGYTPEELQGRHILGTLIPDEESTGRDLRAMAAEMLKDPDAYPEDENENICKDGSRRWIHWSNRLLLDDDGHPTRILSVGQDITDRKRSQLALERNERRFRALVSGLAEGVVIQDANGVIRQWNQAAVELFGLEEDLALGQTSFSRDWGAIREDGSPLPPEEFPAVHTLRTGEPVNDVVMGVTRPNSETAWIKVSTRPLFHDAVPDPIDPDLTLATPHAAGMPHAVVITFSNITELRRAQEALQKSEAQYRILTETAGDVIWTMDLKLRFTYVSPSVERVFGYTPEEFINIPRERRFPPSSLDTLRKLQGARLEAARTGQDKPTVMELEQIRKNCSLIWTEIVSTPIRVDGECIGFTGVTRDITERKKLEALKEDMDRIMRHDIKGPLSGIIALPGLIMESGGLSERDLELLQAIEIGGRKILRLIDASLTLVKLETGEYNIKLSPMDLARELKLLQADYAQSIRSKRLKVALRTDGQALDTDAPMVIHCDTVLMPFLLSNLFKNALEAAPYDSEVTITLHPGDPFTIDVHNDGRVPPKIEPHFFDKYATYGKIDGTGLGTYSAKLIARAHGGHIRMRTSSQDGTVVSVSLPQSSLTRHDQSNS